MKRITAILLFISATALVAMWTPSYSQNYTQVGPPLNASKTPISPLHVIVDAGGFNTTPSVTPTPTGTWSWPTVTLTPTEIYPPAVQTKVAQIYSVALAQSTAIIADALAKQAAVWTAQPSGKPEFIPINPTWTLTPTWVPSMTPSATLTPTPYMVQNQQAFNSTYAGVISAWGDGGYKYINYTVPFVYSNCAVWWSPFPAGLGGPATLTVTGSYDASNYPALTGNGIAASSGSSGVTGTDKICNYLRIGFVNCTPTPNVTPGPVTIWVQGKR